MFSAGYSANKLRTNLRLAINRLKLMEKKKTELAQKARKEIADYIGAGKDDRARIRVEHIIREDYLVEAMELVELYCDMLLARFGLIQSMKHVDEGLMESITSIIWVAPRMTTDVPELKTVSDQLCGKYGKEFGKQARSDEMHTVNERLIHKMRVEAPPKILVERYLIEIAKSHNIPYEPDASILNGEQIEDLLVQLDDDASIPSKGQGNDSQSGPGGGSVGGGSAPGGFGGPPGGGNVYSGPVTHDPSFAYPPPQAPQQFPAASAPPGIIGFPPSASVPPAGYPQNPPRYSAAANDPVYPPPAQPGPPSKPEPAPRGAMPPPKVGGPEDTIPELPSVPSDTLPSVNNGDGGDDLDFDELSKRFEDLKKKK